jgi:adenylylsulfate kinase-like enzyme
MIYWFYGQPGAGKTTLAKALLEKIDAVHVDGDDIRAVFNNKDYSKEGRVKNLTLINNIVRFLDHKGLDVVVSVVSPYQEIRDELLDLNIRYYFVTTSEIRGREDYFVKDLRVGEKDTILDTTNTTVNEILSLYW